MRTFSIYCDGGSRGNPGHAASAFVVMSSEKLVHSDSKYLGIETNNVAEYNSLIMSLEWLVKNSKEDDQVEINLDSQLVYKQTIGEYRVKNEMLKALNTRVRSLEKKIKVLVEYKWSPRNNNEDADFLVNKKLDEEGY